MPTNISPSESEGAKWMKLQLWVRQACENAGITAGGDDPLLSDISPSDSEGVKWAKLQRWVALLAENISGGGGGGGGYEHPATHAQSVIDSSSGWITTALAGKQAAGSYLTTTGTAADSEKLGGVAASGYSQTSHTHNYAGSSAPGGAATTALACTGNAATATTASACSGNSATATTASSCSGNAATATALQTARTINGVSFDGTANITVPAVDQTARDAAAAAQATAAAAETPAGAQAKANAAQAAAEGTAATALSGHVAAADPHGDRAYSVQRANHTGSQAWSTITSTPTTLSGYGITDAQGLDSDLTALAGLSTTGLVARTGSGTAATRTITGTTDQVTVTNGDGVAGNPTLSLPQSIATTSTPTFSGLWLAPGSVECPTGLTIKASTHATSRRAGFLLGSWLILQDSNLNGTKNFALYDKVADATRISVSTSGGVQLNAYGAGTLVTDSYGNVTASSDASLKTVTGSFTRGLDDVLKLTPRTYRWNEKSGMNTEDENVGFIAQEVLESIPEAVGQYRTSEVEVDGKKTKKREKAEYLTLSDRPIIAALVNAVKELKAENDTLSDRLSKLEGKK